MAKFPCEVFFFRKILNLSVPTSLQSNVISVNLLIFKGMQPKNMSDSHLIYLNVVSLAAPRIL